MTVDPYLKALPDLQCGATESVAGELRTCLRFRHHDGSHVGEPGPGESVTWPSNAADAMPNITGLISPYGLPRLTPEELRQQRADDILIQQREERRDAVELAVRAMATIDIQGFLNAASNAVEGSHAWNRANIAAMADAMVDVYAETVTHMAEQLGAYIRNGA